MCSLALSEPVSYFFRGLEGQPTDDTVLVSLRQNSGHEHLDKETLEIIGLFYSIENPELRQSVKALLKSITTQE